MLEVIPAIDLKDGEVVNLRQGKFDQSTVYSQDPVETAGRWVDQGCQRLHIVDLDGALEGTNVSYDMVKAIEKSATIQAIELVEKTGGKSGDFKR